MPEQERPALPQHAAFEVEPGRRYLLRGSLGTADQLARRCVVQLTFGGPDEALVSELRAEGWEHSPALGVHRQLEVEAAAGGTPFALPVWAPPGSDSLHFVVTAADAGARMWLQEPLALAADTRIPLSSDVPVVRTYPVTEGGRVLFAGVVEGMSDDAPDAAIVAIEFLDAEGQTLEGPYRHLARSHRADIGHYRYLENDSAFHLWLDAPERSQYLRARFMVWNSRGAALLSDEPRLEEVALTRPISATVAELPYVTDVEVSASTRYVIEGALVADEPANPRGAVIRVTFVDSVSRTIAAPQDGWEMHGHELTRHVAVSQQGETPVGFTFEVSAPRGAAAMQVYVAPWASVTRPRLVGEVTARPDPRIELSTNAVQREYRTPPGGEYAVIATLAGPPDPNERAALVSAVFLDSDENVVDGPYRHFNESPNPAVGFYQYLGTGRAPKPTLVLLRVQPPAGSTTLRLRFVKWDRGLVGPLWLAEEPTVEPVDVSRLGTLIEPYSDDRQMLSTFAQIQLGQGELSAHVQTLRRVHELAGTPESANALRRAAGLRRELDPSWRPRVPGSSKIERSEAGNRICHLFKVTYPFESSGGAIRNLNTVKSQREVGLAPYVLTPLDYPATNGIAEFETEELIEGVPHIRLGVRGGNDPSLPLDRRLQYDALLTASVVRSRGADVIHAASGFRGYELALKGLAVAEHFDIPLLYEVRSLHEHLWGDAVHDGVLDREWTRLRTAQEDRCIREADGVVTIAEAMRDVLVARGVDRRKIHVIPNGVDANRFRRVEPAPELRQKLALQGKQVVGYISNLSRREGHDVLIQAFAKLSADHPDLRCLIVGDGPLRDQFERLAMSLGVRDRVLFTGEVDHAEINGYYSLIDVFVVPRRADYASDFVTPLKPFEALALERAIVMADRPSLHEIVGNEERGLIFRTGDSDHLAARIAELLADPERRRQLGRDGRRWIFAERTWDQNAKRYKELYANLLASFDSRKRRRRQRVAPETRAVR